MIDSKVIRTSDILSQNYVTLDPLKIYNILKKRSRRYVRTYPMTLIKNNSKLIRNVPIINDNAYKDGDGLGFSRFVKIMDFNGTKIIYDWGNDKIICHVDDFKKVVYDIAIVLKNDSFIPEESKVISILDNIILNIKKQYLNSEIMDEFIDTISPFVSTYSKRARFDINMNLSVIFSGSPGDGKTYFSKSIGTIIAKNIDLPFVTEEAVTFERAAKLADSFVALVDDMNIAHFQRNGPYANICSNILSELDKPQTNRLFLLTTNEKISKQNIDRAFFRPGRVQSVIYVDHPNKSTKQRFCNDMFNILNKNQFVIDSNFIAGITMLSCDEYLSLAELFRMKNLIISDLIIKDKLETPNHYINLCKSIDIPETEDYT